MISISCDKCRRHFTPTDEEVSTVLAATEGKKHAQVLCPHCGHPCKVAIARLEHAVRFATGGAASSGEQPPSA
jgi:hypothetical protein